MTYASCSRKLPSDLDGIAEVSFYFRRWGLEPRPESCALPVCP
ncbi:MAG: hypothetical protein RLZZ162_2234 [Verrucomicrobiota bacterium]|jgi:hypothetical protein